MSEKEVHPLEVRPNEPPGLANKVSTAISVFSTAQEYASTKSGTDRSSRYRHRRVYHPFLARYNLPAIGYLHRLSNISRYRLWYSVRALVWRLGLCHRLHRQFRRGGLLAGLPLLLALPFGTVDLLQLGLPMLLYRLFAKRLGVSPIGKDVYTVRGFLFFLVAAVLINNILGGLYGNLILSGAASILPMPCSSAGSPGRSPISSSRWSLAPSSSER